VEHQLSLPQQPPESPAPSSASAAPESPPSSSGGYDIQYGASFEDALKAAGIALDEGLGFSSEPEAAALPPEAVAAEAVTAPVADVVVAPPQAAPEPQTAATEVAPEPVTPALKRIMDREAAVIAREAELREVKTRLDGFDNARARFAINPVAVIRELAPDIDLDQIARALWYEKLGDAAPTEHRVLKEARGASFEVQKLREELKSEKQRLSEEQARMDGERAEAQFVDGLRQYAATVPADKYRLVSTLSKQNPDLAVRMMHDAARMIAAQGEMPDAEATAKAVEQYLGQFNSVYAPPSPTPAQVQPQASAPPASPNTIRNSHSAVQPARVAPDSNDPQVLRRAGLVAAGLPPDLLD
jgi:hypothetical protein